MVALGAAEVVHTAKARSPWLLAEFILISVACIVEEFIVG